MKKHIFRHLFLFTMGILSIGCKKDTDKIINLKDVINTQNEFNIDNFREINFVKLETSPKSIIGEIVKVIKVKDFFFILDAEMSLSVFDINGKFIRKIGHRGKGPTEYENITDFAVDEKKSKIYINSIGSLLTYDFNGNFLNKTKIKDTNLQSFSYDNENGLFYYMMPDSKHSKGKQKATLFSIYNSEGKFLKKIETTNIRYSGFPSYYNNAHYFKNGMLYYKEEFDNKICVFKDNLISNFILLDLGRYKFDKNDFDFSRAKGWKSKYRVFNFMIYERFIFINLQRGLVDNEMFAIAYDMEKNKLSKFINYNNIGIKLLSDYNNELIVELSMTDLIENKAKLKNKNLIRIISDIDGESNPILAIFKLKN